MGNAGGIKVKKEDLDIFFLHHLDRIYTAKSMLVSELPDLIENAHFVDLKEAIQDTLEDVKKQIFRMSEVYDELQVSPTMSTTKSLRGIIEDSFSDIQNHIGNGELRDMSIIFYLLNVESIEMASFQMLEMAAVKLKNERIKELIKQNYEDAKAARTLFSLISAKYIATV